MDITRLPSGKYRARSGPLLDGKRVSLGSYATREQARDALRTLREKLKEQVARDTSPLFRDFCAEVLDLRELEGIRGTRHERNRAANHLTPLASLRISALTPHVIRTWVRDLIAKGTLSPSTIRKCVSVVSVVCWEAIDRGFLASNPCVGIRIRAPRDTEPKAIALTREEILRIVNAKHIPEFERRAIVFAIFTGLRQGEQWNLEFRDLHTGDNPHVFVRYGSRGRAPKSKKSIRKVPLFGEALDIARSMSRTSERDLVFPTRRGCRRQIGKFGPHGTLRRLLAAEGVRGVRWHDLRHTFITACGEGYFGFTLTPAQIRDVAGHTRLLEQYVHSDLANIQKAMGAANVFMSFTQSNDSRRQGPDHDLS